MRKLVFMLITAVVLSSCAGLTHITAPNSVSLSHGNFKFVKVVNAETEARYILGIGGMSNTATEDVVEKLRQNACLQKNQALADIHIKTTTKVYVGGLYVKRTLTASATVVEFRNEHSESLLHNKQSNNNIPQNAQQESLVNPPSATVVESGNEHSERLLPNKQSDNNIPQNAQQKSLANSSSVSKDNKEVEYTRETAYKILMEINKDLENGNIKDFESTKQQIEAINTWYHSYNVIYLDIEKQLRISKKYLKQK